MIAFMATIMVACSDTEEHASNQPEGIEENESEETEPETENNTNEDEDVEVAGEEETEPEETKQESNEVPREHQNALRSAQNYIGIMPFSEKELFHQLTSEYGDNYPEDAAQYAIENVEVDYKEEALESAINYLDIMPMSDQELYNQLISECGDQFTEEQTQYAIDSLPN